MTPDDARSLVLLCLADVAPDADATGLQPAQDMRRALDLDSMDMLSLVTALSEGSAIEIPDADVEQLTTLGGAIEYLVAAPGSAARWWRPATRTAGFRQRPNRRWLRGRARTPTVIVSRQCAANC